MNIGIFDSGLGGIFVLHNLIKQHPYHNYIYFGDIKHLPYGNKSPEKLKKYLNHIIPFLKSKNVNSFIVACNTISSLLPDYVMELTQLPTINVLEETVLETINVIKEKNIKNVLLIATEGTIKANVYYNKVKNKLPYVNIRQIATPEFVPIVENNLINSDYTKEVIKKYFSNFPDVGLIILGCTHYDALIPNILEFYQKFNNTPIFISSAKSIVKNKMLTRYKSNLAIKLYTSKYSEVFNDIVKIYIDKNVKVNVKDIFMYEKFPTKI